MTTKPKVVFDWNNWQFDTEAVMQPLVKRIAQIILDELNRENGAFDCIWIEPDIGPALAITDGWEDHVLFPLTEARLFPRGEEGDAQFETDDELEAAIRGTQVGIDLFERWLAELRQDLDKLISFRETMK